LFNDKWTILRLSYGKNKLHFDKMMMMYALLLVFAASPLSMQHSGVRSKTGCLEIGIMCPSGATCLPTHCCFTIEIQLSMYKTDIIILSKCNLFSPWYSWKIAHLALIRYTCSLILWYHRFYGSMYSCAISINFRCHNFNLSTTVP
jgi:hypothetical protein